jgi:DNA repair exonuclease SbcCD ATPase subunit
MNIEQYKTKYNQYIGRRDQLEKNLQIEEGKKERFTIRGKAIENIQALIQHTAKETQDQLCYHIEDLVQSAIDSCFPGKYDFFVKFEIKRGKTEARMYLEKNGEEIDPQEATGGGLVDIVSFALRLVTWSLSNTAPILLLDEPFKWLSANLRPLAGEMLKSLSSKLKLQIIMITHDEEMINVSDKVFRVSQEKGISKIS